MQKLLLWVCAIVALAQGCATVIQGQAGVRRKFGRIHPRVLGPGLYGVNPFTTRIFSVPVATRNIEVQMDLPTKEGLTVKCNMSMLYHVKQDSVVSILSNIGENYEEILISSVFRSAARDVSARFFAKDLHSAERAAIEHTIQKAVAVFIEPRGFVVEAVLLKQINLPANLTSAIEQKLRAEQQAQEMEFVLNREKFEAERRIIEAQGIRDAQKIIAEGLSPMLLQWKSLEAFKELSNSNNAKTIFTNGQLPLLLPPDIGAPSPAAQPAPPNSNTIRRSTTPPRNEE